MLLAIALACAAAIPARAMAQEDTIRGDSTIAAASVPVGPSGANWRSDPQWSQAQVVTGFVQSEPVEGAAASERTEVRVLVDGDAIYVGAWLYDSQPERLLEGERRRDASLSNSDAFLFVLDTYHDQQNGFVFGTNPSGIQHDGQVIGEGGGGGGGGGRGRTQGGAGGGFNVNWDGNWSVVTEVDAEGWYALFRIPFSTLRFRSGADQTWGINFGRFLARTNEQAYWSPIPRQYNLYRLTNAGALTEIEVPAQRLMTVTPYTLVSAQRIPALREDVHYPFEVGADAKIGITPSLTLDLTLNTDFAQVEVDEQQLDLTRFSLLFPEKRPFFLENAGRFAVGNNRSAQMFFSRRIGIGDSGAPVPIEWGARASGRIGSRMDVGLLHIRTGAPEAGLAGNTYSVARLSRELPNRSSVGAIFTNRSGVGVDGDYGRTYAVDGTLGLGESFSVTSVFGMTDAPGYTDDSEAIVVTSQFQTGTWRLTGSYDQVGANFNPEVGFLRRAAFRQFGGTVSYSYRTPGISWMRELRPHVNYETSYTLAGFNETQTVHADVAFVWENGAQFTPEPNWNYDGLEEPFRIAPGIEVQPGVYQGWFFAPRFNTSTQRPIVVRGGAFFGHFLSGTRTGGTGGLEFRLGRSLAGEASVEHSRIELVEGEFDTTLARGRLGYSFSPSIFAQALVQYSSQSEIWSGNIRLGWIDQAGTGLFIVYNERQREDGFADPLERTIVLKFSRQLDVGDFGRGFFNR